MAHHPGLWAITSYFNPAGYRNRLKNYRIYRQRLGVPLVTVEFSCGPAFELGDGDADVLVQIRGPDLLWQKERLLNLALQSLPAGCDKVAWLDGDVVLTRADWPSAASRLLEQHPLVQLYQERYNLPPDTLPEQANASHAAGHAVAHQLRHHLVSPEAMGVPGSTHRLGIALGLAWARPFHADVRGEVGCVGGSCFHLWHGTRENRRYVERYRGFRAFDFDPGRDLAVDASGCWRWNSDKPEMHRYVRDYFHSRREDG